MCGDVVPDVMWLAWRWNEVMWLIVRWREMWGVMWLVATCNVMRCHVVSCDVSSYQMMWCVGCHVMSCHLMWCNFLCFGIVSCHVMQFHVVCSHVMSCHLIWCEVMQCNGWMLWGSDWLVGLARCGDPTTSITNTTSTPKYYHPVSYHKPSRRTTYYPPILQRTTKH